jgi:hypothetical protein
MLAELEAILGRWRPYSRKLKRCSCSGCMRIRRTAFSCETCGYAGEPLVHACVCASDRAHSLDFWRGALGDAESGKEVRISRTWDDRPAASQDDHFTLTELRKIVRDLSKAPKVPCTPGRRVSPRGSSMRAIVLHDEAQGCGIHMTTECPVCVGWESSWPDAADERHAYDIIRDIRRALRGSAH